MSKQSGKKDAPVNERVQHALIDALGEDDGIHAYESVEPLLRALWTQAHLCGVLDEREDVEPCQGSPFPTRRIPPGSAHPRERRERGGVMSEHVEVLGMCPVHGRQVFRRVGEMRWWECPMTGSFELGTCGSVIPDETVTPDGGEVVHISRVVFVPDGDGERRVVAPSVGKAGEERG